ncbi:MAG TPA: glycoside hydrolase family 13 protein, partial [Rhodothermales bacterium]|nr:glycoside hydrolase family 13 protein [Rhodothermales bacterium]
MRPSLLVLLGACAFLSAQTCNTPRDSDVAEAVREARGRRADSVSVVPDWAADAVWYQIFPERFRNGSTANDPTRETLETPIVPDTTWRISPWTGDWYARAPWEQAMGSDFYDNGVFHRRYGGDLLGVIEKLDYLQQLGVNALYFNPVFYARSLHKYDGSSFHHVDPYFGPDPQGDLRLMATETADPSTWKWTAADRTFLRLIQEAHRRGMRIVIDGVFNHTGRDFFAFDDIRKNGPASPYKDWYIVQQYDDPATPQNEFKYKGWWGVESLPEFANTADSTDLHPGPKEYVFASTRRWMDPDGDGDPADGIDGWRLDVAEEVPIKFWHDWNELVRGLNPEAYTTTEIWGNASHYLREGEFSGTMSYWAFAYPVKGYLIDRVMPVSAFRDTLKARLEVYPEAQRYALQNLVGSHDTERLASMIVNAGRAPYRDQRFNFDEHWVVSPRQDPNYRVRAPNAAERDLQRLVVLFKTTYVGAPMIYYGDEVGMWGGDDPDDRKPMVWADLEPYQPEASAPRGIQRTPDPVRVDTALLGYYRRAIALRKDEPALRRGAYAALLA